MSLPLVRLQPWYPGQMGVNGSDVSLGLRTAPQGNVFYVDSTHLDASNAHDGTDPVHPMATIDAAIARCVADHQDVIVVGSNHAESIAAAAAINVDIAGVRIVGVGAGQDRPTITFTNTLATVAIAAANVTIENILFQVGVDSLAVMIDVNADDFTLLNCEIRENTAVAQQFLTAIDINGGGANAADRCKIVGCKIVSEAAGATQAIEIGAVQDGIEIVGNWITGDFSVAGIHSGSILTNLLLANNYIRNVNAGDFAVELSAAATGMAVGNRFYADSLATCFDPGSLMCADNLATAAIDTSAVPIPSTAAGPLPAGSIQSTTFTNDTLGQAAYGIIVERATGAVPQTGAANLFTVAGGNVLLKQIIGTITVDIGAVANNTQLLFGATALCANLDINGLLTGSRFSITGTFANAMINTLATVPLAKQATELVLPPGNLSIDCDGSDGGTGRVAWVIVYVPLDLGATVTAV